MQSILQSDKYDTLSPKKNILQDGSTFLFYLAILLFIIGFNFTDSPPPFGWYQQWMPNIGGAQISDIRFVDSLNGFATTLYRSSNDSAYVLKTTNGGDNWAINTVYSFPFYRVQFINQDTGYALSFQKLFKTTNKGVSWQIIDIALSTAFFDMYILSTDTIWGVATNSLTGGVYRTTNGGGNWIQQAAFGNNNPSHIYMYNARMGFIDAGGLRRTSDGGSNWTPIPGAGNFLDMYFIDSLTGWKCNQDMKKTTDGGFNWTTQPLPSGGNIVFNYMLKFSNVNSDTIWGVGGVIFLPLSGLRGILFRTTNKGTNWLFQLPDTSIHSGQYQHIQFVDKFKGWAYWPSSGIHTTTGGDTVFCTSVKQINDVAVQQFRLIQNYPNPFNSSTNIKFEIKSAVKIKLVVYDIQGRVVSILIDKDYREGIYELKFDAGNISSGIYFYSLYANGTLIDTKKMILLK